MDTKQRQSVFQQILHTINFKYNTFKDEIVFPYRNGVFDITFSPILVCIRYIWTDISVNDQSRGNILELTNQWHTLVKFPSFTINEEGEMYEEVNIYMAEDAPLDLKLAVMIFQFLLKTVGIDNQSGVGEIFKRLIYGGIDLAEAKRQLIDFSQKI